MPSIHKTDARRSYGELRVDIGPPNPQLHPGTRVRFVLQQRVDLPHLGSRLVLLLKTVGRAPGRSHPVADPSPPLPIRQTPAVGPIFSPLQTNSSPVQLLRSFGDDIDDPIDGIGPVQGGSRAFHHLDPVDLFDGHRNPFPVDEIEKAVEHGLPVQQHQGAVVDRPVETADTHLSIQGSGSHHIDPRHPAQRVPQRLLSRMDDLASGDHVDRGRCLVPGLRLAPGRDHQRLLREELEQVPFLAPLSRSTQQECRPGTGRQSLSPPHGIT